MESMYIFRRSPMFQYGISRKRGQAFKQIDRFLPVILCKIGIPENHRQGLVTQQLLKVSKTSALTRVASVCG